MREKTKSLLVATLCSCVIVGVAGGQTPAVAPVGGELSGVVASAAGSQKRQTLTERYGRVATKAEGMAILKRIEAKWGNVMREAYNWNADSFNRFYGYSEGMPISVLEDAANAPRYADIWKVFNEYAAVHAQEIGRYAITTDGDGQPDNDVEFHKNKEDIRKAKEDVRKALGDNLGKDLVFVPVAPCTVWDTRFATDPGSAGIINNATTKSFLGYNLGGDVNFAPTGGNANCPEQNQNFIGGTPVATMMIVYSSDASANGWVTLYQWGTADPSQATITHYVSPGPTKTQNVIVKSANSSFDHSATARFANVHMSASVIGYFIRSGATKFECVGPSLTTFNVPANSSAFSNNPACPTGYTATTPYCYSAASGVYSQGSGFIGNSPDSSTFCAWRNTTASSVTVNVGNVCCRIPGR